MFDVSSGAYDTLMGPEVPWVEFVEASWNVSAYRKTSKPELVPSYVRRMQSSNFLEKGYQMHRTPSYISINIYPIVVIRGRRPCVHENLSIATSVLSTNHEDSGFHTVHTRSTAHTPSCSNDCWTIRQSWTRFCHMIRIYICVTEGPKKARWLYMIWYIMGMWTSFHDLGGFWNKKNTDEPNLRLTKIFKEGSPSARRPAATQAVVPPELIISTTQILY